MVTVSQIIVLSLWSIVPLKNIWNEPLLDDFKYVLMLHSKTESPHCIKGVVTVD